MSITVNIFGFREGACGVKGHCTETTKTKMNES